MSDNFNHFKDTKAVDSIYFDKDYRDKNEKLVVKVEYNNNRLNKRIFYDKDGKMKYIEVFRYTETLIDGEHIPEEKCISKIYKPNNNGKKDEAVEDNLIGYRFYAQGYEHTNKGYFTLVKQAGVEDKYSILEEESNENLDALNIMNELFKFDSKDRNQHLVNGNDIKAIAFFVALEKHHNKNIENGRNSKFCILYDNLHKIMKGGAGIFKEAKKTDEETDKKAISTEEATEKFPKFLPTREILETLLHSIYSQKQDVQQDTKKQDQNSQEQDHNIQQQNTEKNKVEQESIEQADQSVQELEGKKVIAIPILMHGHATTLLINHDPNANIVDEPYLFDSSLVHCENGYLKEQYFGACFSEDTHLLNEHGLQVNGTCTYWNYCFLKIISEDKRYEDFNEIKKNFNSGKMQLRLALEMSKIFDSDKEEEKKTIIEKDEKEEDKISNKIFFKFKFENKWYGINKDIRVNKFLRLTFLKRLIRCTNKENSKQYSSEILEPLRPSMDMQEIVKKANKILKNIQNKLNTLASVTTITDNNKDKIFKDWKKELSNDERKKVENFKKEDECSEDILKTLDDRRKKMVKDLNKSKKRYLDVYNNILDEFGKYLNDDETQKPFEEKIKEFEETLEKGLNKFGKNTVYDNIKTIEDEDYENTIFEIQDQILPSRLEQTQQLQNKLQPKQTKSLQEQTKLLNSLMSLDQDISSKLSISNGIGLL